MLTPMVDYCWASVIDAGPALIYHWVNISCLLGSLTLVWCYFGRFWRRSKTIYRMISDISGIMGNVKQAIHLHVIRVRVRAWQIDPCAIWHGHDTDTVMLHARLRENGWHQVFFVNTHTDHAHWHTHGSRSNGWPAYGFHVYAFNKCCVLLIVKTVHSFRNTS